jgi:hypothetical protein
VRDAVGIDLIAHGIDLDANAIVLDTGGFNNVRIGEATGSRCAARGVVHHVMA